MLCLTNIKHQTVIEKYLAIENDQVIGGSESCYDMLLSKQLVSFHLTKILLLLDA